MRPRACAIAVLFGTGLALLASTGSAGGDPLTDGPLIPPIPLPVPPAPPELEPIIGVLSPVVPPVCAPVTSALLLASGLDLQVIAGSDVAGLFGPLYVTCGYVPVPDRRTECPDAAVVRDVLASSGLPAGTVVGLVPGPLGLAVDVLSGLEEALGVIVSTPVPASLSAELASVLGCHTSGDAPAPPDPADGAEQPAPGATAPGPGGDRPAGAAASGATRASASPGVGLPHAAAAPVVAPTGDGSLPLVPMPTSATPTVEWPTSSLRSWVAAGLAGLAAAAAGALRRRGTSTISGAGRA